MAIGRDRRSVSVALRRDRDDGLRRGLRELRAVHVGEVTVRREDDGDDVDVLDDSTGGVTCTNVEETKAVAMVLSPTALEKINK